MGKRDECFLAHASFVVVALSLLPALSFLGVIFDLSCINSASVTCACCDSEPGPGKEYKWGSPKQMVCGK